MSRVFVVQQPARWDRDKRKFTAKYDLTPAADHGQVVILLGPGNIFRDKLDQAIRQLKVQLRNFTDEDFILAIGDPVAIAAAVLIAGERTNGRIKILKWDRISTVYEAFAISTA